MTEDLREADDRTGWRALPDRPRLVLASCLMLFVELALIRWTSANNLYLVAPDQLRAAGQLPRHRARLPARPPPRDLFALVPASLGALVAFVLAFPVQVVDADGAWRLGGALGMGPLPRWVSLPVIFLLTVAVLAGLGQEVARTFARFAPLEAYRLDVLGSLAGIAVFAGLSFLRLPPLAWAVLAAAAFLVLMGRRLRAWQVAGVAVVVGLLGAQSLLGGFHWSPYYKIRAVTEADGSVKVDVNNTPHQTAHSLGRPGPARPLLPLPVHVRGPRRDDVLDHRRRHRQRRGGRAGRGRRSGWTRWRSTRRCSSSAGTGTRSGPTRTRG